MVSATKSRTQQYLSSKDQFQAVMNAAQAITASTNQKPASAAKTNSSQSPLSGLKDWSGAGVLNALTGNGAKSPQPSGAAAATSGQSFKF